MHLRPALAVLAALIVASSALAAVAHPGDLSASAAVRGLSAAPGTAAPSHPAPPSGIDLGAVHAQFTRPAILPAALTEIYPNGSISNSSAPITRDTSTNTYTLSGSFIGGILDERNGSNLIGNGKTLTADTSLDQSLMIFQASNVNVSGLHVASAHDGIGVEGGSGIWLTSDTIVSTSDGLWVYYASDLALNNITAVGTEGLYTYEVSGISVTHTNVSESTDYGLGFDYSSDISVTDTTAWNSADGMYAEDGAQLQVRNVNLTGTDYAFYLDEFSGVNAAWVNGSFTSYLAYVEYTTNVTFSHFAGEDINACIYAYQTVNVWITNFSAPHPTGEPLDLYYVINFTLDQATMAGSDAYYGLYAEYVTGLFLDHVNLSGFEYYGAYVEYSQNTNFQWSQFSAPAVLGGSGVETYEDNQVVLSNDSARGDGYGFDDDESTGISLWNNDFSHATDDDTAVYLEYDSHVQVIDNNIFNASYYGIYSYYTTDATIWGNNVTWSGEYALYLEDSTEITVEDNTLDHAAYSGIYVDDGLDLTVIHNTADHEYTLDSYPLSLYYVSDAVVADNTANNANDSIYSYEDSNVVFEDNNASNAYWGIYAIYDANTTFVGNEIANDHFGFEVDYDSGTMFYHNNFVNDAGYLNDASINNIAWANGYPAGGNYWSNHTGPDTMSGAAQNVAGSDGIVDTPFVINATNWDPYPLAHPWTAHTATFTEAGLTAGTKWDVTIGGATWWSTAASIVYTETNGANASYSYTVGAVAGYQVAKPASGNLPANGADASVSVTFAPFNYSVMFVESGLKAGTTWSVTVNSATLTGATANLSTRAGNGTWSYVTKNVSGYALTTGPGTVTVHGAAVTVTVTYVAINPNGTNGNNGNSGTTSNSNSFSNTDVYALVGVLILALVLAALGFAMYARGRRPKSPTTGATAWTPPPAGPQPPTPPSGGPPGGSAPPPGAMGGSP
jgi:parallel beta-helix repeat protein